VAVFYCSVELAVDDYLAFDFSAAFFKVYSKANFSSTFAVYCYSYWILTNSLLEESNSTAYLREIISKHLFKPLTPASS